MIHTNQALFEATSRSPGETQRLGVVLGRLLEPGDLVLLAGGIGAGKTTLAQGIAAGLGVRSRVSSPTFTLVMEHEAGRDGQGGLLYHIDLYRLGSAADDIESMGIEEYLNDPLAISLIEWPERAAAFLPARRLLVHLSIQADSERLLRFIPSGERYRALVEGIRQEIAGAG